MSTHNQHRSKFPRLGFFCGIALGSGCVGDEAKDLICGGNGERHGDHCDCDAGFILSDDGSSCDPDPDYDDSQYEGDFVFAPSEVQALTSTESNGQVWLLEAVDNSVQLEIEIYESYGGLSSPGSITIDEAEMNDATCGACIVLQTGCAAHGEHSHCERTFMPLAGGEFYLDKTGTNAGDEFTGELLGVKLQEVNIGQDYRRNQLLTARKLSWLLGASTFYWKHSGSRRK